LPDSGEPVLIELAGPGQVTPQVAAARLASELDDALYYLRRGCLPCAERHFDRARRYGATSDQVDAVAAQARTAAAAGPG
jgi:AhpD family alkylhydroperoxidase